MYKIVLILVGLLSLSGCLSSDNTSKQGNKDAAEVEKELLLFDEWLETTDLSHQELIFSDLDKMKTEEIITEYQTNLEVADDWYSVAYTNFNTSENYNYREQEIYTAASTTKVLVAMMYYDLIDSGSLTPEQSIPLTIEEHYQDGDGEITTKVNDGIAQTEYTLDYTIQEMIVNSDNTAWGMLREFYRENFGPLGEGLKNVIPDSKYTAQLLEDNKTSASLLEESLLASAEAGKYTQLLEYMRLADSEMYLKYYTAADMPVKYGYLFEFQHHIGIYEINGQPVYSLVLLTKNLTDEQANEFIGGINLQLSTQAKYCAYVRKFEEN